jgi:hypothetical protein
MANNLKTGWVIIATSGATIDGRKIEKQWLTDMAENYSERMYSAKIWPDHERYFGSQGKVLALKVEPATDPAFKDELQLMAIIAPSDDLVYQNKRGKYVHTSIEVLKNFAGKGFYYLGGLAVTDTPASLGTSELQFSESTGSIKFSGCELDLSSAEPESFFSFFKRPPNPDEQENNMTPEQLAAIQKSQADAADGIKTAFAYAMEIFTAAIAKLAPAPATTPAPATVPATLPAEEFVSKKDYDALAAQLKAIDEKFTELQKTPAGVTKPAGDDASAENAVIC